MTGERPDWLVAVSENRASLERIAKHGQTGLADDVARLLEQAEQFGAREYHHIPPNSRSREVDQPSDTPNETGVHEDAAHVVEIVSWDYISGQLTRIEADHT